MRLEFRWVPPWRLSPSHRVVAVIGLVVMVVGILGLGFNWGSSTTTTTRNPTARSTPAETPGAFLAAFTNAVRTGDTTFLFNRLDSAVLARYGAAQCRPAAAHLADASAQLQVVSTDGPAQYVYSTDGRSTTVPNTYTLHVTGTIDNQHVTRDLHVALVHGKFRIFVDCGQPLPGSS